MLPLQVLALVGTCQTSRYWWKMIRIHLHNGEDSPQLQNLNKWEALVKERYMMPAATMFETCRKATTATRRPCRTARLARPTCSRAFTRCARNGGT
ncbi:hypothetical protein HPB49_015392 [Dermacentor silvarum]|uniref:Uncharacterized protein n=1 Tax=Dermacentor silvarum TaxID=543639 RepID=A0ACB8C4D5_DERSI|nr:hypothetical protein HPB49_015392 [Dermacentor silvarum]